MALIPPRVNPDLHHGGHEEMPGRTRRKTCAMRDVSRKYAHRHGLLLTMDRAALVSMLAIRESIDEDNRNDSSSNESPDMATAPASEIHTPTSVSEAEASQHTDV